MTGDPRVRRRLVRLLRAAYSGELGAALAYQGHARSVSGLDERNGILAIERDEWRHRETVGGMLAELGARPSRLREALLGAVGSALSRLCPVSGWTLPMFCAWRLELVNIAEYDAAAAAARDLGLDAMAGELAHMARVEVEHAEFFRARLAAHTAITGVRRAVPRTP
jgi:demethoxyubiquinone hydroxylase (CLK1/Coq7/Cat5 family)